MAVIFDPADEFAAPGAGMPPNTGIANVINQMQQTYQQKLAADLDLGLQSGSLQWQGVPGQSAIIQRPQTGISEGGMRAYVEAATLQQKADQNRQAYLDAELLRQGYRKGPDGRWIAPNAALSQPDIDEGVRRIMERFGQENPREAAQEAGLWTGLDRYFAGLTPDEPRADERASAQAGGGAGLVGAVADEALGQGAGWQGAPRSLEEAAAIRDAQANVGLPMQFQRVLASRQQAAAQEQAQRDAQQAEYERLRSTRGQQEADAFLQSANAGDLIVPMPGPGGLMNTIALNTLTGASNQVSGGLARAVGAPEPLVRAAEWAPNLAMGGRGLVPELLGRGGMSGRQALASIAGSVAGGYAAEAVGAPRFAGELVGGVAPFAPGMATAAGGAAIRAGGRAVERAAAAGVSPEAVMRGQGAVGIPPSRAPSVEGMAARKVVRPGGAPVQPATLPWNPRWDALKPGEEVLLPGRPPTETRRGTASIIRTADGGTRTGRIPPTGYKSAKAALRNTERAGLRREVEGYYSLDRILGYNGTPDLGYEVGSLLPRNAERDELTAALAQLATEPDSAANRELRGYWTAKQEALRLFETNDPTGAFNDLARKLSDLSFKPRNSYERGYSAGLEEVSEDVLSQIEDIKAFEDMKITAPPRGQEDLFGNEIYTSSRGENMPLEQQARLGVGSGERPLETAGPLFARAEPDIPSALPAPAPVSPSVGAEAASQAPPAGAARPRPRTRAPAETPPGAAQGAEPPTVPPRVPPTAGGQGAGAGGVVPGDPVTTLRGLVNQARPLPALTEAAKSAEKSRRVAAGANILTSGGRTPEAYAAAKAALGGEYPRAAFDAITPSMAAEEVGELRRMVGAAGLRFFEEVNAETALGKVLDGELNLLRPFEIELLDRVFGPQFALAVAGKAAPPQFMDKVFEFYLANILSGPVTQARNIVGNTATAMYAPLERFGSAALEAPVSRLQGRQAERFFAEVPAQLIGMAHGVPRGVQGALRVLRGSLGESALTEAAFVPAISGAKGRLIRLPLTGLEAMDAFFKAVNFEGALSALAVRTAKMERLTGNALTVRVADLMANPTDDIIDAATKEATVRLFRDEPTRFGKAALHIRETVPGARFIIPFARTPDRLIAYGIRRSPLGLFDVPMWKRLAAKNPEAVDELAQTLMGSTIGMGMAAMLATGQIGITGAAPTSSAERDRFYREGKQPFSIKVPGIGWVQYSQIPMLDTTLSGLASARDAFAAGQRMDTAVANLAGTIGQNLFSKSYVSGLSDFMDIFSGGYEDPKDVAARWLGRMGSGLIPASAALRQTSQFIDPTIYKPEGIGEQIATGAGAAGILNIPPRLTAFGEKSERPIPSPITISPESQSAVDKELGRLGMEVGFTGHSIGGFSLDREQEALYQQAAGQNTYHLLSKLVESQAWKGLEDGARSKVIEKAVTASRDAVRDRINAMIDSKAFQALPADQKMQVINTLLKQAAEEAAGLK